MKFEYKVTGKTVDEAYKKAIELYSSLGEISMEEVISQGKRGFLGLFGAQDAEIRIIVDDGKEEKKKPFNKDNKEKNQKPRENQKPPVVKEQSKAEPKKEQPKTEAKAEQPRAEAKKEQPKAETKNKEVKAEAIKAEETKAEKKPQQAVKQPKKEQPKPQKTAERPPLKDEDIKVTAIEKKIAMDFVDSFVKSIGFQCQVVGDLTPNEEGYVSRYVVIEGENVSTLIGHHGETLDAIQYLANLCLARKSDSDHKEYVKVIIDIENYRAKREETLRALARKMADKALRQRRNIHLDPMNPYERRIIHSEIQKIEGVSTHSVGYDETRKIVITVDKKSRNQENEQIEE